MRILSFSYNQNIITSKRDDNGCLIVKKMSGPLSIVSYMLSYLLVDFFFWNQDANKNIPCNAYSFLTIP